MATVEASIDIPMPQRSVYNQWTQFEHFPLFMDGVERVEQLDHKRLHWIASIGGVKREWDAEIVEQIPDERIAWRSTSGASTMGTVIFEDLEASATTRVVMRFDFDPEGAVEKIGDVLGIVESRVRGDLERFRDFLLERGRETGEWRGEIRAGRMVQGDRERETPVDPEAPRERSGFPRG